MLVVTVHVLLVLVPFDRKMPWIRPAVPGAVLVVPFVMLAMVFPETVTLEGLPLSIGML